ncbi:MAG: MFS transporter [Actinomycetota bacterium]
MTLFARRDFLLIFLAFGLSSFGDYLALTTLTLRMEATGSGWNVAFLMLASLLPPVVLAPLAGWLVDRLETVRVLVVTALLQAVVAAALAASTGVVPILGLAFLLGAGIAPTQPALFALLPRAVGEERTTQANAYLEVARWGGAALGPILAAVLVASIGNRATLLVNAATFLLVAALGPLLKVRRPPEPVPEGAEKQRGEARAGIRHLLSDPLLRAVIPLIGVLVVFAAADNVAEVFFAVDVLDAGETGYGVLVATWTVGMVLGSIAGRWLRPGWLAPTVPLFAVVGGGAVALAAALAFFPVVILMFLIGGLANGIELVAVRSLLHKRVPDRLRGRAFAAYYGMIQAAQIVALGASGGLVELAGSRLTMLLAGCGTALVGVVGLILYARVPAEEKQVSVETVASVESGSPDLRDPVA